MSVRWCISEDWGNPKQGEKWQLAHNFQEARCEIQRWIRENMPEYANAPYWRHITDRRKTVIDFGSHRTFGIIEGKEEGGKK